MISYTALDEQGQHDMGEPFLSDTWADLRPSEADDLAALISYGKERALRQGRFVRGGCHRRTPADVRGDYLE